MTAHNHAAMIKAKADNMELVVFIKDDFEGEMKWRKMKQSFPINQDFEYFLCLQQHKEACLHWLNGGDVECKSGIVGEEWTECYPLGKWHAGLGLMRSDASYRIKPRKEKRWIGYNPKNNNTTCARQTKAEILNEYDLCDQWQLIEIEVEV